MDVSLPKISIIVPVYNVEKYLNKCLDSILAQTFEDYELLLIDDGSSDKSGNICDEYEKKDKRVKVFHKENGGLSSARNAGIDAACGEYIGFIDSDDYIDNDMFEILYNSLIENHADISVCGVYDCYNDRIERNNVDGKLYVFSDQDALREVLYGKRLQAFAVNKLYKKEVFNEMRFPVGKIYEDSFLIPSIFANSEKIVLVSVPKYYYQHREGSITSFKFSEKLFDVIEASKLNLELVIRKFPSLKKQAMFRYLWAHFFVLDKMLLEDNYRNIKNYNQVKSVLKENIFEILRNSCFEKSRKVSIILIYLNVKIYRLLVLKKYK